MNSENRIDNSCGKDESRGSVSRSSWYVVQTKPRQEKRALENLLNQGYESVLPLWKRERIRGGKLTLQEEALFPRYIFVRLDLASMNWGTIRATRGVIGLVRFGGIPASIPDNLVETLLEGGAPKGALFASGDTVLITAGPFAGFEGVFDQLDGSARVMILLEFMHKVQRLSVPVPDVRRVV